MLTSGPDPLAVPTQPPLTPGSDPPAIPAHFTGKVRPFNGIIRGRRGVRYCADSATQKRTNRTVGRRQLMCCSRWGASRTVLALALLLGLVLIVPSDACGAGRRRHTAGQRPRRKRRAAVPGATVTAVEVNTSISRTAIPNNQTGYYILSNLKDGTYRVEAELQGFKKFLREGVKVDVNTTVRVDVGLSLGNLSETVTGCWPKRRRCRPIAPTRDASSNPSRSPRRRWRSIATSRASLVQTVPGTTLAAPRAQPVLQLAGYPAGRGQWPAGHGEQHSD